MIVQTRSSLRALYLYISVLNMAAKEERKFILECLKLYKTLPALWNIKSEDYRNRIKKNEQYNQLLRKYRERYPTADRTQLVKKLNALRTNYRKELKRLNSVVTSGTGKLQSTLWYFDELRFLQDIKSSGVDSQRTIKIEIGEDTESEEDAESGNIVEINRQSIVDNSPSKELNYKDSSRDELIPVTRRRIQELAQSETECERIALAWALDLDKMRPLQQLLAKKAINDILFEGQMGTLHRDSVQINRNPLTSPSAESTPYSAVSQNSVT